MRSLLDFIKDFTNKPIAAAAAGAFMVVGIKTGLGMTATMTVVFPLILVSGFLTYGLIPALINLGAFYATVILTLALIAFPTAVMNHNVSQFWTKWISFDRAALPMLLAVCLPVIGLGTLYRWIWERKDISRHMANWVLGAVLLHHLSLVAVMYSMDNLIVPIIIPLSIIPVGWWGERLNNQVTLYLYSISIFALLMVFTFAIGSGVGTLGTCLTVYMVPTGLFYWLGMLSYRKGWYPPAALNYQAARVRQPRPRK